jgi:hypothetical protein
MLETLVLTSSEALEEAKWKAERERCCGFEQRARWLYLVLVDTSSHFPTELESGGGPFVECDPEHCAN